MPAAPGPPAGVGAAGPPGPGRAAPPGGPPPPPPPPEDVGVAALEAHDHATGLRSLDHDPLDLGLGHRVVAGALAHVDDLSTGREGGHVAHVREAVREHDVGVGEGADPGEREQLETPGARTHEHDATAGRTAFVDRLADDDAGRGERLTGAGPRDGGSHEHADAHARARLRRHGVGGEGRGHQGPCPRVAAYDGRQRLGRSHDEHGDAGEVGVDQHGGLLPSQLGFTWPPR